MKTTTKQLKSVGSRAELEELDDGDPVGVRTSFDALPVVMVYIRLDKNLEGFLQQNPERTSEILSFNYDKGYLSFGYSAQNGNGKLIGTIVMIDESHRYQRVYRKGESGHDLRKKLIEDAGQWSGD